MEVGLVFIGNLSFDVTENDLKVLIDPHGHINSLRIVRDQYTKRSKGFAFLEMASIEEARQVVGALNDTIVSGRALIVSLAGEKQL